MWLTRQLLKEQKAAGSQMEMVNNHLRNNLYLAASSRLINKQVKLLVKRIEITIMVEGTISRLCSWWNSVKVHMTATQLAVIPIHIQTD